MNKTKKIAGLALAAAAMFAVVPVTVSAGPAGHCEGVNACKGTSSCKTAANACAGQNACKGAGFVVVDEETCGQLGGKFAK